MGARDKVRIGITCGDPRGIGPEVIAGAVARLTASDTAPGVPAEFVLIGPEDSVSADTAKSPGVTVETVGRSPGTSEAEAGDASVDNLSTTGSSEPEECCADAA